MWLKFSELMVLNVMCYFFGDPVYIEVTTLTFLGHVTSLVTWPFDSQVVISHRCSIGTKSVSPTIVEIMGPKYSHDLDLSGSRYIISHVTIRIPMGHFLLVVHWTQVSIRYDAIEEFNVDWKAEYSALSSTRSQKKKLKQTTPVPL